VGGGQLATAKAADSVVQCHVTVSVSTPTPSLLTSFSELTILATKRDLEMKSLIALHCYQINFRNTSAVKRQ